MLRGRDLLIANCSGCHGAKDAGDGPVTGLLLPRRADLAAATFSPERVAAALWNGDAGLAGTP
nr:c-type cytochrome [Jiella pelagia]